MASIVQVDSTPLKPRSKYTGSRVRHTTGTTRARAPKPRSAASLAISASLNSGSLRAGDVIPRCFIYDGIRGILENGVSNDIVGTGLAVVIPASDPAEEQFRITRSGEQIIWTLLGRDLLSTLGLLD